MAKRLSAPFIECSAVDGVNIDVAFRELVKLVRKDERVRQNRHLSPWVIDADLLVADVAGGAEDTSGSIGLFAQTTESRRREGGIRWCQVLHGDVM